MQYAVQRYHTFCVSVSSRHVYMRRNSFLSLSRYIAICTNVLNRFVVYFLSFSLQTHTDTLTCMHYIMMMMDVVHAQTRVHHLLRREEEGARGERL